MNERKKDTVKKDIKMGKMLKMCIFLAII